MKKILLSITVILVSIITTGISGVVLAKDVIPITPSPNTQTIGMYQVGDDITIYKEPDENSQILYRKIMNFSLKKSDLKNFLQCF